MKATPALLLCFLGLTLLASAGSAETVPPIGSESTGPASCDSEKAVQSINPSEPALTGTIADASLAATCRAGEASCSLQVHDLAWIPPIYFTPTDRVEASISCVPGVLGTYVSCAAANEFGVEVAIGGIPVFPGETNADTCSVSSPPCQAILDHPDLLSPEAAATCTVATPFGECTFSVAGAPGGVDVSYTTGDPDACFPADATALLNACTYAVRSSGGTTYVGLSCASLGVTCDVVLNPRAGVFDLCIPSA